MYLRIFVNTERKQQCHDQLDNYILWHKSSGIVVADYRVRLAHELGSGIQLGGELTRLDVDPESGRYRAVLLTDAVPFKESELRWPLVQLAIGAKFARPLELIDVGTQDFSGAALHLRNYSGKAITRAFNTGKVLAAAIRQAIDESR